MKKVSILFLIGCSGNQNRKSRMHLPLNQQQTEHKSRGGNLAGPHLGRPVAVSAGGGALPREVQQAVQDVPVKFIL